MAIKEECFKQIIEKNKERIMRICQYYAPSNEDIKDMYQETLINIWHSLDSFKGNSEIGTWIYRIAVNTSLAFAGKHFKRLRLNVDMDMSNMVYRDNENDEDIEEEHLERLQISLNQLPVIDKALMGLVLEGLSTKEIAAIIGITEPNVRVKIHRIKQELKTNMKGDQYE